MGGNAFISIPRECCCSPLVPPRLRLSTQVLNFFVNWDVPVPHRVIVRRGRRALSALKARTPSRLDPPPWPMGMNVV